MANPNNIYKNSFRVLALMVEDIRHTKEEAEIRRRELQETGIYHMVKITKFKSGARPNKWNNWRQNYNFCIRAYSK